jgi:hypothetical protein
MRQGRLGWAGREVARLGMLRPVAAGAVWFGMSLLGVAGLGLAGAVRFGPLW